MTRTEDGCTARNEGVRVLLENLIDYAGLFPPAKLDMAPMVQSYASHLAGPAAWLVERVIVPAGRLAEFEAAAGGLLPTGEEAEPWPLSVLVGAEMERDLESIAAFNERHADPAAGLAVADVIEVRVTDPASLDDMIDLVPEDIFPFFELAADPDPRGLIATLVGGDAGAKIRTGGITPDLYPDPAHVARFIRACADADVPFKATAGMHHPLRHYSEKVKTEEFGFLNVFAAAAIAMTHDVDDATLVNVLTAQDAGAFEFDDDGLTIAGHRVELRDLEDARLGFAVSFGSCSIDEPVDDLRSLGLLA